jgi:hypothetical protein
MTRFLAFSAVALVLTACGVVDPFARPGTLRMEEMPTVNAASMVANPYDMVRGHGDATSDGHLAAAAVDRARLDSVKPILGGSAGVQQSANGSDSGAPAPAAAPTP